MWVCQNCKEENEDTFDLCWNCQTEKGDTPSVDSDEVGENTETYLSETEEAQQTSSPKNAGSLYGKDEQIISMIGHKFSISFLVGAGISSTSLMVTNRRMYGAGNRYSLKGKTFSTLVGELKALHSIGLEYSSNFWFLIIGIPLLAAYGAGVVFILLYFWTRHRHIQVNFGGEVSSFSLRGISNEEVERFIKKAMLAKEKA